jgi:mannosyltransferase OCH1-like enzyme
VIRTSSQFNIIEHGIKKLRDLNPEYEFVLSDDHDVESYLKDHLPHNDYELLRNKHIVEKTDLWRLMKIYHEGGIYSDIDRFCNKPLPARVTNGDVKCVLPTAEDLDFSQDLMISCPGNIIHKRAIELNLERRRNGETSIYKLGPVTYLNAVTEILIGTQTSHPPNSRTWTHIRNAISTCQYIDTFREVFPFDTLLYSGVAMHNDKVEFYNFHKVKSWTETP